MHRAWWRGCGSGSSGSWTPTAKPIAYGTRGCRACRCPGPDLRDGPDRRPAFVAAPGGTVTFTKAGSPQVWKVPNGVHGIAVDLWGAGGGGAAVGMPITCKLAVQPGLPVQIIVGKGGEYGLVVGTGGHSGTDAKSHTADGSSGGGTVVNIPRSANSCATRGPSREAAAGASTRHGRQERQQRRGDHQVLTATASPLAR